MRILHRGWRYLAEPVEYPRWTFAVFLALSTLYFVVLVMRILHKVGV